MLEAALHSHLLGAQDITDIVHENIYPVKIPPGIESTSLAYEVSGRDPFYDLGGSSGLDPVEIEVNCWSQSYLDAKRLAAAVKQRMSAFAGTIENEVIRWTRFNDETDRFEKPDPADDVGRYLVVLDFTVFQRN